MENLTSQGDTPRSFKNSRNSILRRGTMPSINCSTGVKYTNSKLTAYYHTTIDSENIATSSTNGYFITDDDEVPYQRRNIIQVPALTHCQRIRANCSITCISSPLHRSRKQHIYTSWPSTLRHRRTQRQNHQAIVNHACPRINHRILECKLRSVYQRMTPLL